MITMRLGWVATVGVCAAVVTAAGGLIPITRHRQAAGPAIRAPLLPPPAEGWAIQSIRTQAVPCMWDYRRRVAGEWVGVLVTVSVQPRPADLRHDATEWHAARVDAFTRREFASHGDSLFACRTGVLRTPVMGEVWQCARGRLRQQGSDVAQWRLEASDGYYSAALCAVVRGPGIRPQAAAAACALCQRIAPHIGLVWPSMDRTGALGLFGD